jgi:hypothetical protein
LNRKKKLRRTTDDSIWFTDAVGFMPGALDASEEI